MLEKKVKKLFSNRVKPIISKNYNKIVKKRVVEKEVDKRIKKIITINDFENKPLSINDEKVIIKKLNILLPKSDIVIVQDFGHNLFSNKIRNLIQNKSKFLSINVQTNSLNYGFNIIDKKYSKANMFTLDEKELELCASKKNLNHLSELKKLFNILNSENSFLTCGGKFSLALNKKNYYKIPTLNNNAIDSVGAGDIFHCMSSVISKVTKNLFLNLLISQISGALAVNILGNSGYPKINEILKTLKYYKDSLRNN